MTTFPNIRQFLMANDRPTSDVNILRHIGQRYLQGASRARRESPATVQHFMREAREAFTFAARITLAARIRAICESGAALAALLGPEMAGALLSREVRQVRALDTTLGQRWRERSPRVN